MSATATTPRSATADGCALIELLAGGLNGGAIAIQGRTPSGADSGFQQTVPITEVVPSVVPDVVLTGIEDGFALTARAAVQRSQVDQELTSLSVLPVEFAIPADRRSGQLDSAALDRAESAILRFPLRPAFVALGGALDASGARLFVAYGLARQLDVRSAAQQRRAVALVDRLAVRLGAQPAPARVEALAVPVPGSLTRVDHPAVVIVLHAKPQHRHALDTITAALDAPSQAPLKRRKGTK